MNETEGTWRENAKYVLRVLSQLENRFKSHENRLQEMDRRLDKMEQRLVILETKLSSSENNASSEASAGSFLNILRAVFASVWAFKDKIFRK